MPSGMARPHVMTAAAPASTSVLVKPSRSTSTTGWCRENDWPKSRCRRTFSRYLDRKSTRLNSSHSQISYAVFCLKKKNKTNTHTDFIISTALHHVSQLFLTISDHTAPSSHPVGLCR